MSMSITVAEENRIGQAMHERLTSLYPICRSITGNGVRDTLSQLRTSKPLQIHKVDKQIR